MNLTIDDLKKQLATAEAEFEQVKAQLYRIDGVVQILKGLISKAEQPIEKKSKSPKEP